MYSLILKFEHLQLSLEFRLFSIPGSAAATPLNNLKRKRKFYVNILLEVLKLKITCLTL
jgi:hypothetical protein